MEEKKLRQLFKNRADAYLNTIDESVEQGMSEDCFIKAVKEVFSLNGVGKSFYCYDKIVNDASGMFDIPKCDKQCEKCKQ